MSNERRSIERVGLLFSGGPAPGGNAVIAAAASALRRAGVEVVALLHGYSALIDYDGDPNRLREGQSHRSIGDGDLWGLRNARGIAIGTARVHPGREVKTRQDLDDPGKTASLRRVYDALCALSLDGLVSIGGDGTLRSAALLHSYQERLPQTAHRVRVLHVPKTIDNDYAGIDFTFGFFTAVDVMAKALLNLRADAVATRSYYLVTTMGRRAGWLAYGVAVAGEAHLVIGVEDAESTLCGADGRLDTERLCDHIVDLMLTRERRGKHYGTVVLAEGLSGLLPDSELRNAARDAYGHVTFATFDLSRILAERVATRFRMRTGRSCKVTGVQLGYESRSAAPHAFDVLLGTQLGLGAVEALLSRGLQGHMVSVAGQLQLDFVPFERLIDPATLSPRTRMVPLDSDFRRLARSLGTRIESDE